MYSVTFFNDCSLASYFNLSAFIRQNICSHVWLLVWKSARRKKISTFNAKYILSNNSISTFLAKMCLFVIYFNTNTCKSFQLDRNCWWNMLSIASYVHRILVCSIFWSHKYLILLYIRSSGEKKCSFSIIHNEWYFWFQNKINFDIFFSHIWKTLYIKNINNI